MTRLARRNKTKRIVAEKKMIKIIVREMYWFVVELEKVRSEAWRALKDA